MDMIVDIIATMKELLEKTSINLISFMNLLNTFYNKINCNNIKYFLFCLFMAIIVCGLIKKAIKIKNICNELLQVLCIVIFGMIVSFFKFEFIKNITNNVKLIFIMITLLLIILFIIEFIMYSNSKKDIFIQSIKNYSICIKFEIFICSMILKLTVFELLLLFMNIIVIDIIISLLLEKTIDEKKINIKNCMPIESNNQLFSSRKKQLEFVQKELINKFDDINSVVISGNWGTGKSSFVNVLKKELLKEKMVDIINVQCGIECDLKQILNSISLQIENIMKKNNIYTRNNGIIHKYFKNIYNLVENTDYEIFANAGNLFENNPKNFLELRHEMNNKLNKLDRKIFIFIDDLDRILDEESRINILKIIYESINLNKCLTVFSLDIDRFLDEKKFEYIEKYVDFNINLTNIDFNEIVDMYKNDFFSDDFVKKLSSFMIRDRIPETMVYVYKDIIKSFQELLKNDKNTEEIKKSIMQFKNYGTNPRKVKSLIKIIENMLEIINEVWFKNDKCVNNEYTTLRWVEMIVRISFLNVFYKECFDYLYFSNDILDYKIDTKNEHIYTSVLKKIDSKGKEIDIYRLIIYQMYTMDINNDKTLNQAVVEELNTDNLKKEHLNLYFYQCLGINCDLDYTKKVISFIEKNINSSLYLGQFIGHYMKQMNNLNYLKNDDYKKITRFLATKTKEIIRQTKKIDVIIECIREIIRGYIKIHIDGLNELVGYIEKIDNDAFIYPEINNIDELIKSKKILKATDPAINNYILNSKKNIENIDIRDLPVKNIFLNVIDLIENILNILIIWEGVLNDLEESQIYYEIPDVDDYDKIIKYLNKVKNTLIFRQNDMSISLIEDFQKFTLNFINNTANLQQKNDIKNEIYEICAIIEESEIINHLDKIEWDDFLLKVFRTYNMPFSN